MFYSTPFFEDSIPGGWSMCLDFLDDGTLYGGQPYCNQAPLIYYIGLFFKFFFDVESLWIPFFIFKLCCFGVILQFMNKFIGDVKHPLMMVLFLLFFVPLSANKPEMLASTAFFMGGAYMQLKTGKHWLAGVYYGFSIFFKYTAGFPIAFLLMLNVRSMHKLVLPSIVLGLLFQILHPLVYIYSIFGHSVFPATDFFGAVTIFFSQWDIHLFALIFYFFSLIYVKWKKLFTREDFLFLVVPFVSIFFVSFGLTKSHGVLMHPEYYALQSYPFLILGALKLRFKNKLFFAVFTGLILVFPAVTPGVALSKIRYDILLEESHLFEMLVLSGISVLPQPEDGFVFESSKEDIEHIRKYGANSFFKRYGWRIDTENTLFISSNSEFSGAEDAFWGPKIRNITDIKIKYSRTGAGMSKSQQNLSDDLLNGKYDMVLTTAKSWTGALKPFMEYNEVEMQNFCRLYAPDFAHRGEGRFFSVIVYNDMKKCREAAKNMKTYYESILDKICVKSEKAAKIVSHINNKNGMPLKFSCKSEASFETINYQNPNQIDFWFTLIPILCLYYFRRSWF